MMDHTPLVCDYGSGVSKVGFAGAEGPLAVFPTILGKLKHNNLLVGVEEKDWFVGAEAQNNLKNLNMHYPITRGAITDWDDVEKIWHHSFYQVLRVAPEEHPLMITEPPLNSTDVKCRMTQILFETFNVPALYVANQGVLSMYAAGRTSGITIECGEGMTYFVPVINGFPLQLSTTKLDIAGQDLTTYLLKLLSDSGNLLVSTADREYIRDLKEKHCYVTLDYDMEISKNAVPSQQKKVQLPDGREVSLEQEALTCSEALFNTSLIGRSNPGIHMQVQQSITSCDHSHWRTLFGHIILSGGTGAFSGLRLRLQREISKLVSPGLCVKLRPVSSPGRKVAEPWWPGRQTQACCPGGRRETGTGAAGAGRPREVPSPRLPAPAVAFRPRSPRLPVAQDGAGLRSAPPKPPALLGAVPLGPPGSSGVRYLNSSPGLGPAPGAGARSPISRGPGPSKPRRGSAAGPPGGALGGDLRPDLSVP
ncbi:actin-like [Microtus ochrogaster]|uniref:Actin-like n=1 Tax=Microtus ochrogaster TaxID=79684 RepID=A0ABM1U562_MICOH|nr:actin-like [Microtus ochrogaster]